MSVAIEKLYEQARAEGLEVALPGPRDIFVDLDQAQDQYVMEALLPILAQNGFPVTVKKITRSRSGNKHAYLEALEDLDDLTRLLLQACLGSDRKRELLGFLRAHLGKDSGYATAFFEVPKPTPITEEVPL